MSDIGMVLRHHGIDTGTLEPLPGFGGDPVQRLIVGGEEGLGMWRRLRAIVDETQHWPVILGDDDSLRLLEGIARLSGLDDSQAIIASGESLDAATWLASERDYSGKLRAKLADPDTPDFLKDSYRQTLAYLEAEPAAAPPSTVVSESWPDDVAPNNEYISPGNVDGVIARLSIGLVPVKVGWHVPAVLRFGHFNSCPPPHVHVCMLRHWHRTHGAELVAMTHDTVELHVPRPPTTREEAYALDRDHSTYCSDACEQLGLHLDQMPGRLLGGSVWTFWWD